MNQPFIVFGNGSFRAPTARFEGPGQIDPNGYELYWFVDKTSPDPGKIRMIEIIPDGEIRTVKNGIGMIL